MKIAQLAGVSVLVLGLSLAAHAADAELAEANAALKELKTKPELKKLFGSAHGYAVFPTVTRGALGVGGAYGKGVLFKKGKAISKVEVMAVSIGLGAGGEAYTEIIFFKDAKTLDRFVEGNIELSARANAVAVKQGVSAEAAYTDGMAIVTLTKGGLMADASVGGQKFSIQKL